MKAAVINEVGAADTIHYSTLPLPVAGPTDVQVRVEYTAVNHIDTFIRSGAYPTELVFPFPVGRDLVGTVRSSPTGKWQVGDRVWSNSMGYDGRMGAAAEVVSVPEGRLFPVPDSVKDPRALVALSHSFSTAYLALAVHASLSPGDTVFIAGGAGAVGSAAVQYAHLCGAQVVATASARDMEWVESLGADLVVDHHREDLFPYLHQKLRNSIDIWWDTSGHIAPDQAIPLMKPRGTVLVSAGLKQKITFTAGDLYPASLRIQGFAMSTASVTELSQAAQALNKLLELEKLEYRIGRELPLSRMAQAHHILEEGAARGKIIVQVL